MRKTIYILATLFTTALTLHAADIVFEKSEPLTVQPEGRLYKNVYRTASGYYVFWGEVGYGKTDGIVTDLVEAADGSVYILNPYSTLKTSSWLKAERGQGDTLEVKLPQVIMKEYDAEADTTAWYYACRMNYVQNESMQGFVTDSVNQTMKFTWRNDTLTMVDDALLGLADGEGYWMGYGDDKISMFVCGDKTVTPPATAADSMVMVHRVDSADNSVNIIGAVTAGNDIWLNHIDPYLPEAWVKGTIEGNKAVFRSGQYLGVDTLNNVHAYFVTSSMKRVWDDIWEKYTDELLPTDSIVFDYDAATHTLRTDSAFLINQGKNVLNEMTVYKAASISPWKETALTPANPVITDYEPFDDQYGWGILKFHISKFTADGKPMDPSKLFYNIYYDGELETFYPDEYVAIKEEMTDVPVDFTDNNDFYTTGNDHSLYFQAQGVDQVGVQVIYTGGGETRKSDIVYSVSAGITAPNTAAGHKAVKRVEYIDMAGRRSLQPVRGLNIRRTVYADGTVKTDKINKR